MFKKLNMKKVEMNGKRIFMRLDFDVPIVDGKVVCNKKIEDQMETVMLAIGRGAKAVIMASHVGCPEGRPISRYSLKPVAKEIEKLLKRRVLFLDDTIGRKTEAYCADPSPGSLIMLENLRFHREEEGYGKDCAGTRVPAEGKQTLAFREGLARLADLYVNEAFPLAYLNHSSIIAQYFCPKAAGLLFMEELRYFSKVLNESVEPFLLIIGGEKFCEKAKIILNLLECVNEIIIGGQVAVAMLKVLVGMEIGSTPLEPGIEDQVKEVMVKAKQKQVKIHFPVDFVVGDCIGGEGKIEVKTVEDGVPSGMRAFDIGPKSQEMFGLPISNAKTIIWNAPLGVYQADAYSSGTQAVVGLIAVSAGSGALAIAVGDDTAAALRKWNMENSVSHISIGGETGKLILEGEDVPGIINLNKG